MERKPINNIKLGVFVLSGLFCLILLLYMIGKNRHMFGSSFILKARFQNVQGLKSGNNVRFAGIDIGTVKEVTIIEDTLLEVVMIIDEKMKSVIHKNAVVSIGTDGLVGNKVANILPGKEASAMASNGDLIESKNPMNTDEMLQTLSRTNNDIAVIAENLKITVTRLNNSNALWSLLNEKEIPESVKKSAANIRQATAKANDLVDDLHGMVNDVKGGKGSLGVLLKDTAFSENLNAAITKIKEVGTRAEALSTQISTIVSGIENEINSGKGPVHALLKDSSMVTKLNLSLENIQQGTDGFNQNMEALKHNFLFRGYFRNLEKKRQKELKQAAEQKQAQKQ